LISQDFEPKAGIHFSAILLRKLPSLSAGAFFLVLAFVRLFALFVVFPALRVFVREPAGVGSR
jgi:hypothetical protein